MHFIKLLIALTLITASSPATAAILGISASGATSSQASLATCRTASGIIGCRVTSPLSAVQSNISSASGSKWGTTKALTIVKGGSLGNTTKFDLTGAQVNLPDNSQVFAGTGSVANLAYVNPVWFPDTQAGNQQAFNAVASGGVLELTTARTVTSITAPVAMTIKGKGSLAQAIGDVGSHILTLSADGTTVDGITITGPVATGNANHTNVAAINIQGRSGINIKNCTITGKQNGIQNIESITAVTDVRIENNTIRHTGYGIVVWPVNGAGATTDYGNQISITGNDVRLQAGFDATSESVRGIRISHCDNVNIKNNTVLGQSLTVENWQQAGNRDALNVNVINNNVDMWMSYDGVDGGTIKGNTVDYGNRPAVALTSVTYGTAAGIEVIGSQNILIDSNRVLNQPGNGIYTGYAGNGPGSVTTSHHLTITNNVINDCALTVNFSAGVQLGYVHDIKVSNNQINSCGGAASGSYAIVSAGKISGGTFFAPVYNISFENNTILDTVVAGATTGAVHLHTAKGVLFSGNTIKNTIGTVANGLSIGAGFMSGVKILGNVVSNNLGHGLFVNGAVGANSREVVVENNDFSGNGQGATETGSPGVYLALRYNKGLVNEGSANARNTFEIGDLYNITHATNKWVRATAAGTFIVGAPISLNSTTATATTTASSAIITVNTSGALSLDAGQYISITGVTGTKQVRYITYTSDANGFTGATVVLNSTCDASVSGAAISYVAGTMAQVL